MTPPRTAIVVIEIMWVGLTTFLTIGLPVPLFLWVVLYAQWREAVVHDGSAEAAAARNSFPYVAYIHGLATTTCVVAAIVMASWTIWWLRSRGRRSRERRP